MTVLCDQEIEKLCEEGLVDPYEKSLIGPASLDVRLGETIKTEEPGTKNFITSSIAHYTPENPYRLDGFTLGHTLETFFIPDHICAFFALKSSRGREGVSHALSGFCDPGWNNSKLTLELHSLLRFSCPEIWPGMRIGQLVFIRMSMHPKVSYSVCGHYNNDQTVMSSKGYFN